MFTWFALTVYIPELSTAIEFMLSDEYEIKQTEQHLSYKGYPCRRYVVSINA